MTALKSLDDDFSHEGQFSGDLPKHHFSKSHQIIYSFASKHLRFDAYDSFHLKFAKSPSRCDVKPCGLKMAYGITGVMGSLRFLRFDSAFLAYRVFYHRDGLYRFLAAALETVSSPSNLPGSPVYCLYTEHVGVASIAREGLTLPDHLSTSQNPSKPVVGLCIRLVRAFRGGFSCLCRTQHFLEED